jgi:hypothetical protein
MFISPLLGKNLISVLSKFSFDISGLVGIVGFTMGLTCTINEPLIESIFETSIKLNLFNFFSIVHQVETFN